MEYATEATTSSAVGGYGNVMASGLASGNYAIGTPGATSR